MSGLLQELKKRKVVRAGIAYAVAGFIVLQAGDLILNGLGAPVLVFRILIIVMLLGFPVVLGLAWAFDVTPAGVQRAPRDPKSATVGVGLVLVGMIIAFVAFAAYGGFKGGGADRQIHSIGVLPFVNMSDDKQNEYFSDGMTEELLNVLAKVEGLQVASRTSSFQFKGKDVDAMDAARRLGVGAILEGSVRQSGNQLRITAQLIDASNGFHLWSETYDRELEDVFALQDEIARVIVDQLKLELGVIPKLAGRTENVEAYKLYLQGNYHLYQYDEVNIRKAIRLYEQALALDSTYARAWAGVSHAWTSLADEWVQPKEAYPAGTAAAQKAIALDSTSAEAHLALSHVAMWHEWNPAKAEREVRRAAQLDPNAAEPLMYFSWYVQDTIASKAAVLKAQRLDPLNPSLLDQYIPRLAIDSQFTEATKQAEALIGRDPGRARSYGTYGSVLRRMGRREEAYRAFRRSLELSDTLPFLTGGLITMLVQDQKLDELRHLRDRLIAHSRERYVREDVIARLFVLTGDHDGAFEWIDRAIEARGSAGMSLLTNANIFLALHDDPRWASAIARIKPVQSTN